MQCNSFFELNSGRDPPVCYDPSPAYSAPQSNFRIPTRHSLTELSYIVE